MAKASGARGERTLRHQAYDTFTERLLAQEISPGQFISQRELVELTRMPLGAIRELIPRLEADGLIRTIPQRGMQIAHIDLELIRNAFQLRLMIEREAARIFVQTASDQQIEDLYQQHLHIQQEASTGVVSRELLQRAQSIDWGMHDMMVDHLQNELVSNVYRVNSIKIRLIRQERIGILPELVASVMEEHLKIIAAFQVRDEEQAVRLITERIEHSRSRALKV